MKLTIGSDHAGFALKNELIPALKEAGYEVEDLGTHSEQSCDYPDIARDVGDALRSGRASLGILICGTGIGMSMAANKMPGVRAALCSETFSARMARRHNDANVLCLGARVVGAGLAWEIVDAFLKESFEGGRHQRRVDKLSSLEN